jgi:hypothetical protein
VSDTLVIEHRFHGPPDSGNGGYSCGLLGARIDGPSEVTLRLPPPLDEPLRVEERPEGLAAMHQGEIVMLAARTELDGIAPGVVSLDAAEKAAAGYEGFQDHAFPSCFVCGPERDEGDGLRIFPGDLGEGRSAAPWTPHLSFAGADGVVRPEIVWAALDCPTGWSTFHASPDAGLMLLGRMAAKLLKPVIAGETYIAAAWPAGNEGRKHFATGAILSAGGEVHAVSRATWIELRT